MKITYGQLLRTFACDAQRYLFQMRFGDKVEVTLELCEQYRDFDYTWAAMYLLSETAKMYYLQKVADLWKEYATSLDIEYPYSCDMCCKEPEEWDAVYEKARPRYFFEATQLMDAEK